jgi:hypothetical protein
MPVALNEAVKELGLSLRQEGYKRFGQSFNRETEPGLIHVLGFQGSKWGDRFTVNAGVYVREIDELFDDIMGREGAEAGRPKAVREGACWLRARIGDLDQQNPHDTWWPYAQMDAALLDLRQRLIADVGPALVAASTRSGLLAWWDQSTPRAPRWRLEPRSPLGFALLLRNADRVAEAQAIVQRLWEAAAGRPFQNVIEIQAERLELGVRRD